MKNKKHIYTLKSECLDKVVHTYIDYVSNPLHPFRQNSTITMSGDTIYNNGKGIIPMPLKVVTNLIDEVVKTVDNLPKPKEKTAIRDIALFIDTIYRKWRRQKTDENFTLSSLKFRELGIRNYNYIAYVMRELGYIYYSGLMKDGDKFVCYYNIERPELYHLRQLDTVRDRTVIEALKKKEQAEELEHKQKIKQIIKHTSKNFVKQYNDNLWLLAIDKNRALESIASKTKNQKKYYEWCIETITSQTKSKKELLSMDENGRLYHIGTGLPNELKKYTNIAYSYDAANSHLVLFCIIILKWITEGKVEVNEKFKDTEKYKEIIETIKNTNNYHIFGNCIHNNLICNTINNTEYKHIQGISEDTYRFIKDAMNGNVWTFFCCQHPLLDRSTVKQSLFCDVFYSYGRKKSEWVNEFEKEYPTVWGIIQALKKTLHEQCQTKNLVSAANKTIRLNNGYKLKTTSKDNVMLPHLMMRFESKIFLESLRRLFEMGVKCFGIHDAVYVLQEDSSDVDVHRIIMDVYREHGLHPTLKREEYC